MTQKLFGRLPALLLLVVAFLFVAGCGSSNSARFRVIHASPDEVNFDVLLDSKAVSTNVGYGTASGYQTTSAGAHQVELAQTLTTNSLISQVLTFNANTDTTILATNYAVQIAEVPLLDNNSVPTSGNFNMRLVNAAPAAGPVDVYIVAAGTDINGVSPTVSALAFESASSYQSLAAGTFEVVFAQAGTKNQLFIPNSAAYTAGQIRTVVLLNQAGGGFTSATITDLN